MGLLDSVLCRLGRGRAGGDPRNLITQNPRDGLGDMTSLVSPDTGTASYTYDAAGNLKTRTDSRGVLATYSYDVLKRLTSIVFTKKGQTTRTSSWTYDQTGAGFANGIGRLTSTTFAYGSTKYAYDPQGRLTSDSQTVNAQSGASAVAVTTSVAYAYDAADLLTSITYPSGRKASFTYTSGQLSAIALAKDAASTLTTQLDQISYAPFGGASSWNWQMASGAQANLRIFDTSGRLVRFQLGNAIRDITYDAANRITGYTHYDASSAAPMPSLDQGFSYDELGRLTSIVTVQATGASATTRAVTARA